MGKRRMGVVRALPLLGLIVALAMCDPPDAQFTAVPTPAPARPASNATDVASVLGRYASNLLVLTLFDDAEPPRFTDVALPLMCAETGDVFIDGVPLTAGAMVPAGSFTVQWRLRGTCPFGAAGPGLHGDVDVRAVRDDDACVQAIVVPPPAVLTAGGRH